MKALVTHPKLYMLCNGKLQRVEKGSHLTLNNEQAKKLSGFVKVLETEIKTEKKQSKSSKKTAGKSSDSNG